MSLWLIGEPTPITAQGELYIQYLVITCNGKESEKEYVYVCITESLCCIPETNTTL